MKIIRVPTVAGPRAQLCYETPPLDGADVNPMRHCDRRKGHEGPHLWALMDTVRQIRADHDGSAQIEAIRVCEQIDRLLGEGAWKKQEAP